MIQLFLETRVKNVQNFIGFLEYEIYWPLWTAILFWFLADCLWSNWGPCSVSCGYGIQARHWKQETQNGGENCIGNALRNCSLHNMTSCPGWHHLLDNSKQLTICYCIFCQKKLVQSNLAIRIGLIRNLLVSRNHFP